MQCSGDVLLQAAPCLVAMQQVHSLLHVLDCSQGSIVAVVHGNSRLITVGKSHGQRHLRHGDQGPCGGATRQPDERRSYLPSCSRVH